MDIKSNQQRSNMKRNVSIKNIKGMELLDSRSNPTVSAEVILSDNTVGRACVPSGASTGAFEAHELRDGDKKRYNGKGVQKAVSHICGEINALLQGDNPFSQRLIDNKMISADGTANKSKLGANAILAVSLANARAAAKAASLPLYQYLGGTNAVRLPIPMMNIVNGGAHASNNVDIQEFMIMPIGAQSFKEALRWCSEVYHTLASLLRERGLSTAVGDEGGFAPNLEDDEEAIKLIISAVEKTGYSMGADFVIALDAAASEWKAEASGQSSGEFSYFQPKSKKTFTSSELIEHWCSLADKYPIRSIEDALDEDDWDGWRKLTKRLGSKVQLVGDDLFVTNTERLKKGIELGCANSILIKLNQIGSLTETMDAIEMAHKAGYTAIVSHRSGETEDTTIADLAVAMNTGQIKTGAPCRTERVAKYNRLLYIEQELQEAATYSSDIG